MKYRLETKLPGVDTTGTKGILVNHLIDQSLRVMAVSKMENREGRVDRVR